MPPKESIDNDKTVLPHLSQMPFLWIGQVDAFMHGVLDSGSLLEYHENSNFCQ